MSSILGQVANALGMNSKYKLYYFDGRGRAEPIRWVFAHLESTGVDYEDIRIAKADWPAKKESTPFGQLPYLEVDGQPIAESFAIARYVARKHGAAGADDFEAAQADALADYVQDGAKLLSFMHTESDEKKKSELKTEFINTGVQPYLKGFERHLLQNNNGEGYLVGKNPTWADFVLVVFLDVLISMDTNVLDNYQPLKVYVQRVHDLKGIKEWLVKRPVTQF